MRLASPRFVPSPRRGEGFAPYERSELGAKGEGTLDYPECALPLTLALSPAGRGDAGAASVAGEEA